MQTRTRFHKRMLSGETPCTFARGRGKMFWQLNPYCVRAIASAIVSTAASFVKKEIFGGGGELSFRSEEANFDQL